MAEEENEQKALYEKKLQQMQVETQKRQLLRMMLEDAAYDRMINVRLSNPQLYEKVISSLAYVAQSGKKMDRKITEQEIYSLLVKMTKEPETSIEIRRK